jgi:hypothetical protein
MTVGILYREMRSAGESGHEESTIFTPDLLAKMRVDDPHVDALMPFVARDVVRRRFENRGREIHTDSVTPVSSHAIFQKRCVLAAS